MLFCPEEAAFLEAVLEEVVEEFEGGGSALEDTRDFDETAVIDEG